LKLTSQRRDSFQLKNVCHKITGRRLHVPDRRRIIGLCT